MHATVNDQMDLTQKTATGNGSNLVHRHLVTGSTNVPSFIPRLPREPPQPMDGLTGGHSPMHATENNQMEITRKPATDNGSNLVHRHLLTCSTNVPSFIPRLPLEPPQPMDGRTRSRACDCKRSNGPYAKNSHRKWFKFGTQTPCDRFYQCTEFHPPTPPGTPSTDGWTDGRTQPHARD